jgi:CheY-like chemotaxis protein
MSLTYNRGSLTFTADDNGGFACQELQSLPEAFATAYAGNDALGQDIEARIDKFRKWFQIGFNTKEERDAVSETERHQRGAEMFDSILPSIRRSIEGLKPMEQFLFWLGHWWYYHPEMRAKLRRDNSQWTIENSQELVKKYILPLLPEQIRKNLEGADSNNVAVGFGHFAILFTFKSASKRRIVTDTQLFELDGVNGYMYIDVTPDGKPIARSACDRGGERAFFDGIRLMSHDKFQTCAPNTVMINGGYKVNSTKCTIVNGMLFDLIDVDDKVAYTHGAFLGMCDFSNTEALASYALATESGKLMRVENNNVILNGETLSPIGVFMPSRVKLLDNGFTQYDWSDFEKISGMRYASVLVVDDKQSWLDEVRVQFGGKVKDIKVHLTSDKHDALTTITETNPKAVLLDMHLTAEEEFEGLWIARTLIKNGFKGTVMLASGYPEEHLRAMRVLINAPVHIPGKKLDRVGNCLTEECNCLR